MLLDLPTLHAASYRPGAPIDRPTEYWMGVDTASIDDVAAALAETPFGSAQVRTVSDQAAVLVSDPMALSVIAALSMGFVAALVFAIIGFTVNIIVLARERQTEFTLLRALGLSIRQLRSWLGLEQAAVVFSGLALGTFIGAVLSWMILPLISVTQAGVVPVPAPKVLIPIVVIVGLNIAIFVVLAIVVSALAYMSRRRNIASQLRMGD